MASTSQHDWSLHRKGPIDQARHGEKIKEAIKENLPEIIAEEAIITSDGKRLVKVPIRTLEEYRFRFDPNQGKRVGQGDGDSQVGDVIARGKAGRGGPGTGSQPGNEPGFDYYEAEVTVDELAELIFEDLGLPDLKPKSTEEVPAETVRFTEVRKKGPMSNLDRKRTIMENLKRNARLGRPVFGDIQNDDLRFKVWEQELRPSSSAVVLAMRDASGSMGEFKKYITRSLFFWMKGKPARSFSGSVDKLRHSRLNSKLECEYPDNGKPVERRGRKATGLRAGWPMIAGLPKDAIAELGLSLLWRELGPFVIFRASGSVNLTQYTANVNEEARGSRCCPSPPSGVPGSRRRFACVPVERGDG